MMDNLDDDDERDTNEIKSTKIQPMKPSDQEIATHESCGHYPYRDWCRACVGNIGRSDARKRCLFVASMDYGFFVDGDDGEHTRIATLFLVVKIKPSMMIWSMFVLCNGVEDQTAIKETVESSNRLGDSELIVISDGEPATLAFRAAATAAYCRLLVKLGFTEFAVKTDAMFADEARLREQFQQLWNVLHNRELLAKRLKELFLGQFPSQSFE